MSPLDRPFPVNTFFAKADSGLLYLETDTKVYDGANNDAVALVYVQNKRYSVMCSVEDDGSRLPLACRIGGDRPDIMVQLLNDTRAYTVATTQHYSDRDGSYKLHTLISNQILREQVW